MVDRDGTPYLGHERKQMINPLHHSKPSRDAEPAMVHLRIARRVVFDPAVSRKDVHRIIRDIPFEPRRKRQTPRYCGKATARHLGQPRRPRFRRDTDHRRTHRHTVEGKTGVRKRPALSDGRDGRVQCAVVQDGKPAHRAALRKPFACSQVGERYRLVMRLDVVQDRIECFDVPAHRREVRLQARRSSETRHVQRNHAVAGTHIGQSLWRDFSLRK